MGEVKKVDPTDMEQKKTTAMISRADIAARLAGAAPLGFSCAATVRPAGFRRWLFLPRRARIVQQSFPRPKNHK